MLHRVVSAAVRSLALLALLSGVAVAQSPPGAAGTTRCDTLVGMPAAQDWVDIDRPGPLYKEGRSRAELDAIIAACGSEAKAQPKEARFVFRLGLALRHAGRSDEALAAFQEARRLGLVGGFDESAVMLIFGNSSDRGWRKMRPKQGLALLDEGYRKSRQPVLAYTRALAWLNGPREVANRPRALKELRRLGAAGYAPAFYTLGRGLLERRVPKERAEGLAMLRKAVALGSGGAAYELGSWIAKEDPQEAHRLHMLGAERGDPAAMNAAGYDYEYGRGAEVDLDRARRLYEQAAKRGHLIGLTNLANTYASGRYEPTDYETARRWLEIGVERGDRGAMMQLGMLYDHGRGVPADQARARELYERSAALGDPAAMNNMGYLFEHGRAAEVDWAAAISWYRRAIAAGNGDAMSNLGLMLSNGKGIARDEKEAFRLFERSAEANSVQGTNNLAMAYLRGEGVEEDAELARHYFEDAAKLGSKEAAHNLASMLEKGEGGEIDYEEALRLFKTAAEGGIPNAMYRYAMLLRSQRNDADEEVRLWLTRAVAKADEFGLVQLARMMADGIGGPAEPEEAAGLYRRAGRKDHRIRYEFATRLRVGRGVPKDPIEARLILGTVSNHVDAAKLYVRMLDAGEGGPADPDAATKYLTELVAGGDEALIATLAIRLAEGIGTKPDGAAARALLEVADLEYDAAAALLFARLLERGEGGPVDRAGAIENYRLAARNKRDARLPLAQALRGDPKDEEGLREARELLRTLGSRSAEAVIARVEMYDRGEGGPADPQEAARGLVLATLDNRDPRLVDLLARPGQRLKPETRAALFTILERTGMAMPPEAATQDPLLTEEAIAILSRKSDASDP